MTSYSSGDRLSAVAPVRMVSALTGSKVSSMSVVVDRVKVSSGSRGKEEKESVQGWI